MLVGTAVVLAGLVVLHLRFDELYALVVSVGKEWEGQAWFQQVIAYFESLA